MSAQQQQMNMCESCDGCDACKVIIDLDYLLNLPAIPVPEYMIHCRECNEVFDSNEYVNMYINDPSSLGVGDHPLETQVEYGLYRLCHSEICPECNDDPHDPDKMENSELWNDIWNEYKERYSEDILQWRVDYFRSEGMSERHIQAYILRNRI